MKKLFLIPLLVLAFIVFPGVSKADDKNSSLSQETIEDIVDKVLELDEAGKTKAEIVTVVDDMLDSSSDDSDDSDEDSDDSDKSNKGKSSVKKLNFGQFKKMVKKGDNGQEIADLQEALNKIASDLNLNFNLLLADGKFGPATVQVVKMIQAHQQIVADGVVGPTTLAKLQALLTQIENNVAPVITLVGSNPMTVSLNGTYTEPGATAIDTEDGVLTSSIVITGTVNTAVAGAYTVKYNVKDSDNKSAAEVSRTVNVQ